MKPAIKILNRIREVPTPGPCEASMCVVSNSLTGSTLPNIVSLEKYYSESEAFGLPNLISHDSEMVLVSTGPLSVFPDLVRREQGSLASRDGVWWSSSTGERSLWAYMWW